MTSQVFGDVSPQLIGLVRDALQSHQLRNEPPTDAQVQSIVQQVLAAQQPNVVPVQVTVGNPQQPQVAPAPQVVAAPVLARRPKRRGLLRSWKFWTVLLLLSVFGLFASKTPISVVRVPGAEGATGRVQAPGGYTAPATGTGSAPATQAAPTAQPTPDIGNNDPAASAPSDYVEQTKPNTRTAPGQAAAQQSQNDKPAHTEQAPAQPEASVEGTHESGPPPPSAAEAPAEQVVVVEAAPPAAASTEHTKASTKRAPGSK